MWAIKDGTELIARGDNIFNFEPGVHFLSNPDEWMQYAVLNVNEGTDIQRHIHKRRFRHSFSITHEFFIIWFGCLLVQFFSTSKELVSQKELIPGDFFCQYSGGHGFVVLAPGTLFIEVKHGPFTTIEDDKEKF